MFQLILFERNSGEKKEKKVINSMSHSITTALDCECVKYCTLIKIVDDSLLIKSGSIFSQHCCSIVNVLV